MDGFGGVVVVRLFFKKKELDTIEICSYKWIGLPQQFTRL
jgi:hypothetical protein